jgi:hypothetical protein
MADAVSVAPDTDKVLFENDRVRILEFNASLGNVTEMHSHPDIFAVGIDALKVKFTLENGESMDAELNAGDAMFMDGHSHATEVTGGGGKAILVELK